ncbi:MAG: hypothetical protein ACD_8C00024G0002 [uncultured bacterium]|nr:MAG: hypothetical protein ACD_8C00024G0002 [uncultured bacterium]
MKFFIVRLSNSKSVESTIYALAVSIKDLLLQLGNDEEFLFSINAKNVNNCDNFRFIKFEESTQVQHIEISILDKPCIFRTISKQEGEFIEKYSIEFY